MGEGEDESDQVIESPFQPIPEDYINYPSFIECLLDKAKQHTDARKTEWMTCAYTGEKIEYGCFDDMTRRIGSALYKRGLRKGDIVIYMTIDIVKVPLFLGGVWRANGIGRASYPEDEPEVLLHRVKESRTGWIYCEAPHAPICLSVADKIYWDVEVIVSCKEPVEGCTTIYELMEDDGSELPELDVTLDTPCLIMNTSGTTGMSKGAVLNHSALMWMTACMANGIPLFEDKNNVMFTKATHISGVLTPFGGILSGKSSVILTYITRQGILDTVDKYKPGFIFGFPTFLLLLVNDPEAGKLDLSGLEIIGGGGAPVTPAVEKALMTGLPSLKCVLNMYGLTECAPLVTNIDFDSHEGAIPDCPEGSTGKLCPGVSAKFLDETTGELKNIGEVGELCCKCPGLFHDYYLNPEATEKAFHNGYFKTGDMAYADENGFIFLVDRAKEIFKYRGNHVSPTELENVILAHPAIGEVCVIGIEDPDGMGHLPRAVCVSVSDVEATAEEIEEYANSKLADYKHIRGGVFFVKELPKGKTGKVTRQLVEKMDLENRDENVDK